MKTAPVAALLLLATTSESFAQDRMTAFVNVNLIRMDRERVEPEHTVVVRGDRIVAIGRSADLSVPPDADMIDGAGRYLLPGLTDSHVHITTDMPWAPTRPDFGDAPLYLAHGVTTVVNLRGTPAQLEWKRRIESGELLAPTVYTAGEFVNQPRVITAEDVRREVSDQARSGYDLIKFHEIWSPGEAVTTPGLSRDAYAALFQAARDAGIPVVGHVPVHLGLESLLASSGGAVAHIGELNRLHFVLGVRVLLLTAAAALILFVIVTGWGATWLVRRVGKGPVSPDRSLRRAHAYFVMALAMMIPLMVGGLLVGPGGHFYESRPWRIAASVVGSGVVIVGVFAIAATVKPWRDRAIRRGSKIPLAVAALVTAVLLGLVSFSWLPFLSRNDDAAIGRLATRFRDAGIAVQSTLVVYDVSSADGSARVVDDPAFKLLAPRVQALWKQMADRRGSRPATDPLMPPRLAEFIQTIAGTFHRHGVQLLAGTDAMGVPMVMPGHSLLRELELLKQSGLTAYEAIRAATVNPARFLGKETEFGSIALGARADCLLLDRNPLESLSALTKPTGVMVRGRWLRREDIDMILARLR